MTEEEKICPRCAETIKRAAVVCRYCGHEFGEAPPPAPVEPVQPANVIRAERKDAPLVQPEPKQNRAAQIAAFGCLGLLVLFVILAIIGGSAQTAGNNVMNVDANAVTDMNVATDTNTADADLNATEDSPAAESSGWSYETSTDELRGKTIYYARADSANQANFDFPYAGGSTLTMVVRRHPKYGDDVYFRISSGQFVCGIDDCEGTINYGAGPRAISLSEPDDNSSDMLFAANGSAVIGNLKTAKRVIVELPFYQEGNRQFTFETKGLTWPPKG